MLKGKFSIDGTPIEKLTHGSEKRVLVVCNKCGKENEIIYSNYLSSQKRRNNSGETFCISCSSSENAKNNFDRKNPWNKGKYLSLEERNLKSYISFDGYRMVPNGKIDRNIKWNMFSKEHILIIENKIGRKLKKGECIHHIDGDKLNNQIENLKLLKRKEHREAHFSLQKIGYELIRNGFIEFDKEKNIYIKSNKLKEIL